MRTWWTWASVLALCLSPALAQARDRGHDRRDDGGRHASARRQAERREPRARNSASSSRGIQRSQRSGDRPNWSTRQRSDSGRDGGRRWSSRNDRSGWDRDRRNDSGWRGSYRTAPRRGWPLLRVRPLRHPSYYRYGYYYGHGYYFPRYYYDYDRYRAHASIRILVEPEETEVYVDGYYAGVVDDFDGVFQRLNLTPGGHEITLRLDGFQTWRADVFVNPGRTLRLRHDMLPGPGDPELYDSGAYEEP